MLPTCQASFSELKAAGFYDPRLPSLLPTLNSPPPHFIASFHFLSFPFGEVSPARRMALFRGPFGKARMCQMREKAICEAGWLWR